MLEWLREEGLKCSGCGMPRDETMDPAAEGQFRARAFRCHACSAREKEAAKFAGHNHDPGGLHFSVERL